MSRLKFLRDEVETVEEDGIKVAVKVVSTSQQARVIDLHTRSYDAEGKAALFAYILNLCVASVTVDGEAYEPADIADKCNIADDDTFYTIQKMCNMALVAMGVPVLETEVDDVDGDGEIDDEKKSG